MKRRRKLGSWKNLNDAVKWSLEVYIQKYETTFTGCKQLVRRSGLTLQTVATDMQVGD